MSVTENLEMGCYGRKFASKAEHHERLDWVFETFPRLAERRAAGGWDTVRRRTADARHRSSVDGEAAGVAARRTIHGPRADGDFADLQDHLEINAQGVTVLLVEQNAQQALSRSDRAYIMETGDIVRTGPARELLADNSIRTAYLGVV